MTSTTLTGGFSVVTLDTEDSSSWAWTGADGLILKGVAQGPHMRPRIQAALESLLEELDTHYRRPVHVEMTAYGQVLSVARRDARLGAERLSLQDERVAGSRELYRSARAAATWESWDRIASGAGLEPRCVGRSGVPVVIAADGSFNPATKDGVWCWYASDKVGGIGVTTGHTSGYAELRAIHEALSHVAPGAQVTILSDCQGVIRALGFTPSGGRLRGEHPCGANREEERLRAETRALIAATGARVKWVRGHNGHGLHTEADLKARAALRAYEAYHELVVGPAPVVLEPTFLLSLVRRITRRARAWR